MKSSYSSKTYGEAFIVAIVVAGFFWLVSEGKFVVDGFWSYAGLLGMIVGFYFALLLCHMIFFHMIGGGYRPWWEEAEQYRKLENVKKVAKK